MPRLTEIDLSKTKREAAKLVVLPFADSTSSVLQAGLADAAGWPDFSVVVTDDQRAGRGRLDRTWSTPAGDGLAMSVLVRDIAGLSDGATWLPLVAGTAVRSAVAKQLTGQSVEVKWPNDVLVDGKKICGVLVQMADGCAIVGIGINTAMTSFPVETATSFAAGGVSCDIDALLADVLAGLHAFLGELRTGELGHVREVVAAHVGTIGASVRASLPGGDEVLGTARSLARDGSLVIETPHGERTLTAGDIVHVRRA